MSQMDIKITELEKQQEDGLQSSQLILQMEGKLVMSSLVNSFRRTMYNDIPTYAFHPEFIDISENTSIFDNDEMKIRISQMTIKDVNVPVMFLEEEYIYNTSYMDPNKSKHKDDNMIIEMYINAVNTSNEIMNVTTNNVQIYINGEVVKKYDENYPHLIVQLRPSQVFKCRALCIIGVGLINNIWSGVANSYYSENNNKYKFTLLSQGQMDEYELMVRSCRILKYKINDIMEILKKGKIDSNIINKNTIRIKLENINYTIGNVINDYMQENENIIFSSIIKHNQLVNDIVLTISTNGKMKPMDALYDTIKHVTKIYDNIEEQLKTIGKKYILTK